MCAIPWITVFRSRFLAGFFLEVFDPFAIEPSQNE
jgi:hypothetical protein